MYISDYTIKLIFLLTIVYAETKRPPGYIEPPKVPDPNPPNYEYGYSIADEKGDGQGKQEQRDGIYALGRYYVQGKQSSQKVQYFADDWGYHPVVEYDNVGPHSRATAHFALGEEAVKQLKNKENNLPQLQGILENSDKLKQPTTGLLPPIHLQSPSSEQPQQLIIAQPLIGESNILIQPQIQTQQSQQEFSAKPGQQPQEKYEQQQLIQPQLDQQPIEPETIHEKLENQSQPQHQEILLQQQQLQSQEQSQKLRVEQELQVQHQQQLQHYQQPELADQPQEQQQEAQKPNNVQREQAQSNNLNAHGEEAQQQLRLIYQQYQPQHQIYIQQPIQLPQIQQILIQHEPQEQVVTQETSENNIAHRELEEAQQVLVKHEEPKQKLIFPQEKEGAYEKLPQEAYKKEHPRDNIIYQSEGVNQQLLYLQEQPEQQNFILHKQQTLVKNSIDHTQAHLENQQQVDIATSQYETAALYENPKNNLVNGQQLVQHNEENKQFDESNMGGGYGSKISAVEDTSNKLIEHTKNLVTGEDVLNINEAISKDYHVKVEPSTPNSIVTEYGQSHLLSGETIANVEINQSKIGYSATTISPLTEASLVQQPIVVAELEESAAKSETNKIEVSQSSQEEYSSTMSTNVETVSSDDVEITSPSTVLVTPRPVSSSFLAPITAGIQLQNIELHAEERTISGNQNYNVEIQKSLPYYLGKFEYPSGYGEQQSSANSTSDTKTSAEIRATENIELGKTLLFFPGQNSPKLESKRPPKVVIQQPFAALNNHISIQHVPSTVVKEKFFEYDQQPAQGYQHQVVVQHVGHVTQKPTEVTKVVHQPYPVKVPYEVPYPVVKEVQVPVTVQKIIEKPIHITKYIEKPVPVPQPYPVEKIVEKPIHVPVQVTKYIDRPYPVEVRVPYLQPYPVEKVVQRIVKQPYPVEVRVPVQVEKIIEKKVPVPHYIEKPVEKIVEKPVAHYVDRPYPVEVKVPVPQPYLVRVEVPKPYPVEVNKFIQKPYPTQQIQQQIQQVQSYPVQQASPTYLVPQAVHFPNGIQVGAPLHIYGQTSYSNNKQEQHAQQSQQQTIFFANPYAYAPQINQYLPPKQEIILSNGYLPVKQGNNYSPPKKDCDQQKQAPSISNYYYTIKPDDYIGLLPPKASNNQPNVVKKLRTARSNFDDKSVRMEYGFLPPLIPSLEIDEQGNPIEKGEK